MDLGITGLQHIREIGNKGLNLRLQNFAILYTELIADNALNSHKLSKEIASLRKDLSKIALSKKIPLSMSNALNGIVAALNYIKMHPSDKENDRVLHILNLVFSTQKININR
jgi:hypothetical protein